MTRFGPAPHKLILLLAILDEAERGHLTLNRVAPTERLERRFAVIWQEQVATEHHMSLALPFFHLQHDGFWLLHAWPDKTAWLVAQTSVSSLNSRRKAVAAQRRLYQRRSAVGLENRCRLCQPSTFSNALDLPVKAIWRGQEVKQANHENSILCVPGLDVILHDNQLSKIVACVV